MWVLLSSRLRTWVLLAIAIPLARALVHRAHGAAQRQNKEGAVTSLLGRADGLLVRQERRRHRRAGDAAQ